MKKIRIYHFLKPGTGGVNSVVTNLLKYADSSRIENHIVYTGIAKQTALPQIEGAVSTQFFNYSPKNNFYHTSRQLAKMLPATNAIIVAHDWLELGVVSALGLQHKVIQFLHGDYGYYYELAVRHQNQVNGFITVAGNIKEQLIKRLPQRKNDIFYCRFPVSDVLVSMVENNNNIIFVGRLEDNKGYNLLPLLAAKLKAANIQLNWHIAGEGDNQYISKNNWDKNIAVNFYGNIANESVLNLLTNMKFFILPSLAEGMPVALIEAMKAGAIPLTNDIAGGIQELVINDVTGYKIKNNDVNIYAEKIIKILSDQSLALKLREESINLSQHLFDGYTNTKDIEEKMILICNKEQTNRKAIKIYGSRLDSKMIPNGIVYLIRSITSLNKRYGDIIKKSR